MGGVAIPVVISGQFRENQSYSGTIGAKTDFHDPSGTHLRNPGLSRRFRDSWQLMSRPYLFDYMFLGFSGQNFPEWKKKKNFF